jgi:hypothetical protein
MQREQIKVLLAKLQRLSEAASASEHEASLAGDRISEICKKYGLAMTEVTLEPDETRPALEVGTAELGSRKRWPQWYQMLSSAVAEVYGVKLYLVGVKLVLVGEVSGVTLVEQSLAYLIRCVELEYRGRETRSINRTKFFMGAAVVLARKLKQCMKGSTALTHIVAEDLAKALDRKYGLQDENLPSKRIKIRCNATDGDMSLGMDCGAKIDIHGLGRNMDMNMEGIK